MCGNRRAELSVFGWQLGGTIAGRDDVVREGKAQQDNGDAQRDAAKKEAEAESARAGAGAAEERQKQHQ
ncbi:CsbD family protein [Mycobacterium sp.]|uniref:CsbD family protein n=1 Tax=Mycobacterium sp. TaxID=1785 RepID=UPI003F9ABBC8